MDKIDERYKRGKIYTVRCRYDDDLIYVGSTIGELCVRMAKHRRDKKCSLFQYVNGDWNNWYIELYENYPCNNKSCLEKREGEVIRLMGTINKYIAGRTRKESQKEYYKNNKEKYYEKQKKYYEEHKEKVNDKNKKYRENNKEKLNEKNKEYYESNKEYFKKYYENNKEKVSDKNKKYYENNKEKVSDKNKKYYENNKEKISEKIECDKCKSIVTKCHLKRHKKSNKCRNYNVNNN